MEGDSPVHDTSIEDSGIPSRAGHEKSCLNSPGPPGKAKYSEQGGEIDPEPARLQAVGATRCGDGVPFA